MKQTKPIRIVNIITRLILAGAQEDTLLLVEGLKAKPEYEVYLISGPAIGSEGELISRAKAHGVNLTIVPEMRRNIYPLKDFISFIKLHRLIKNLKPMIVHTHSSKAGILGRLAAKIAGVKIIVHTIYGPLPFHPMQNKFVNLLYIFLEKITTRWTTKLISIADAMTTQCLAVGVGRPEQFQTIRSGIELDKFLDIPDRSTELRQKYGIKDTDNVIGVVAILVPRKGHMFLMEIAPRIIRKFPETKFLFVGDGVLREDLKSEARKKGIYEHIIFTGHVNSDVVPHLIRLMDMLVHPSLREGLPRALAEAYLLKKPVVCFAIDGAGEIIINNDTGYLVPPKNTEQLYNAIELLLIDKIKARKMGEKGYQLVKDRFDRRKLVGEVDKLYSNLLELADKY